MDLLTIERIAENYALATYLSEYEDIDYDEIMEAFMEDKIPDSVIIWEPFEDFELTALAEHIENTRNDFLSFAEKVKGV